MMEWARWIEGNRLSNWDADRIPKRHGGKLHPGSGEYFAFHSASRRYFALRRWWHE